ncbi:MAG: hypothetical protein RSF68_07900 [Myroides sp.]
MKHKKQLPLNVLKALEPYVNTKTDVFHSEIRNTDNLLEIYDNDLSSDFHFIITEQKKVVNGGNVSHQLKILHKPADANNPETIEKWSILEKLATNLNFWVNLVEEYNNTKSFLDDQVLNSYEAEFFTEFTENINVDISEKPFTIKQQLALDKLFEDLKVELKNQSAGKNSDVINMVEDINQEISKLQENVSVSSKEKVIKSISKIYAKISKLGINFIKAFGNEVQKQFMKTILDGSIDFTKYLN